LLYRRLTNQPETTKPDLGKLKTLPTRAPKQNFSNNSFNTMIGDFERSSSIDPKYSSQSKTESEPIDLPNKDDILREFKQVSAIGRNWIRTIDNKPIERQEKSQVIESINSGHKTILIVDSPGSGKTCLLLDLLEYYKQSSSHNVLFIRGDEFNDANEQKQLPEYLVEKC
jgi:type I site-specific restriction endonuclease